MEINKKNALKLWSDRYGSEQIILDFSGRKITRSQYGEMNSITGWNIDHRQPLSNGGTNNKENLEIVNVKTNVEKADKISFKANGKCFQVKKDKSNLPCGYCVVEQQNSNLNLVISKTMSEEEFAKYLYKQTIEDDIDFAGNEMEFEKFGFSWGIAAYIKDKHYDEKFWYVASLETLKYSKNKSSFKMNDLIFQLISLKHGYRFVCQNKILDNSDVLNVKSFMDFTANHDNNTCIDTIYILLNAGYGIDVCQVGDYIIVLEEYLKSDDIYYSLNTKFMNDTIVLMFTFKTPEYIDSEIVHDFAIFANTLIQPLIDTMELINYGIIHDTISINSVNYVKLYSNLVADTNKHFPKNTLIVTNDVREILLKCNLDKNTFIKCNSYLFEECWERNFIFKELEKIIR